MGHTWPSRFTFEHNNYFGFSIFAQITYVNYSFSQWTTNWRQDLAAPASITSNPQFASPSTNDFHLLASPASTLGRAIRGVGGSNGAIIPAGAYITGNETIGLSANAPAPAVPRPPSSLRIVSL